MDFLGLANLTMLAKALENIKLRHGIELDLGTICRSTTRRPTRCWVAARRGPCSSLKVAGMTRYIQELQPSTLDHLAAHGGAVSARARWRTSRATSPAARAASRPTPPDASLEDVLRRELRDHRLPGPGAPGGAQAGRLQPGPGRRPAPRDGQEGQGGHGRARARSSSRPCVEHGYPRATAEQRLGAAAAVRRLRLQQGARLLLRAGRLPDGVSQGELSGGVVRGGAEHHRRGHRQSRRRGRRVPTAGHRGAAARRQPQPARLHASSRWATLGHPLRAGRDQERGRGRGRADQCRARRAR